MLGDTAVAVHPEDEQYKVGCNLEMIIDALFSTCMASCWRTHLLIERFLSFATISSLRWDLVLVPSKLRLLTTLTIMNAESATLYANNCSLTLMPSSLDSSTY